MLVKLFSVPLGTQKPSKFLTILQFVELNIVDIAVGDLYGQPINCQPFCRDAKFCVSTEGLP